MRRNFALSFFIAVVFSFNTSLISKADQTFLPENNLHLQNKFGAASQITEEQFNAVIDRAIDYFKPFADIHAATLTSIKKWSSATVNATAQRKANAWSITMYGGLARRPEISVDGFMLVVCHELGHHLGGFAFRAEGDWASSEGQSDYFSTQACARVMWEKEKEENALHRETVAPAAKQACDRTWKEEGEQNLCYRITDAGLGLGKLLMQVTNEMKVPAYDTPDATVVTRSSVTHPNAQCRLDTYLAGALCKTQFDLKVIPGLDHADGQSSIAAEQEAVNASCSKSQGHTDGLRPACWFKARL